MKPYCGRFAPSPTGPLHFGSLVAAVGSYLEARCQGGIWRVRMEDIDQPRWQPGAAEKILKTLEAFGFEWDGPVLYQSRRPESYRAALDELLRHGLAFPCACTRKELADSHLAQIAPDGAQVYPGTCRQGLPAGKGVRSWRLRVPDEAIAFDDAIQGTVVQNLAHEVGDFVLLRADGFFAYQLAVVVDDAEQGVTQVVRGADLLESTSRQIYLQRLLAMKTPDYAHLPVAVNAAGEKLSKQTCAPALDDNTPNSALWDALDFLGQSPQSDLRRAGLVEIWQWARSHWEMAKVPRQSCLPVAG